MLYIKDIKEFLPGADAEKMKMKMHLNWIQ